MSGKPTIILAVILLALAAYVYIYEIKGGEKRDKEKELATKAITFEKESITGIELYPSGIVLRKFDHDWRIEKPIDARTDKGSVNGLLAALDGLKLDREIVDVPSQYGEFGLDPPETHVVVHADQDVDTLLFGDKTPTGQYVFARKGGERRVVTVSTGLSYHLDKKLFDFRDKSVLWFEQNEVRRIQLKLPGDKTIECRRDGENWQLVSPLEVRGDKAKIDQFLRNLKNGRVKEFIDSAAQSDAKYGFGHPRISLTLSVGDEEAQKRFVIGGFDPENSLYYARDEARMNTVLRVDTTLFKNLNYRLFDFRHKKLTDFQTGEVDLVELASETGKIVCGKDSSGTWWILQPDTLKAKSWKVSSIVSNMSSLRADAFVERERVPEHYGFDDPSLSVTLKSDDRIVAAVEFGRSAGKDRLYARNPASGPVVEIEKKSFDRLNVKLEDIKDTKTPSGDSS